MTYFDNVPVVPQELFKQIFELVEHAMINKTFANRFHDEKIRLFDLQLTTTRNQMYDDATGCKCGFQCRCSIYVIYMGCSCKCKCANAISSSEAISIHQECFSRCSTIITRTQSLLSFRP